MKSTEASNPRAQELKDALYKAFLEIEITPEMLKPRPEEGWEPAEPQPEQPQN